MTATRVVAALLLACASCAFAAANLIRAERDVQATTALVRASLAAPAVSAADTLITFTMPRLHALRGLTLPDTGNPIPDGYRLWQLAYSTRAKACADSGLAWCRDTANFHVWIPQARTRVVLASGYARPGERVVVRRPRLMSLALPATWWCRTWTDTASVWQMVGTWGTNE